MIPASMFPLTTGSGAGSDWVSRITAPTTGGITIEPLSIPVSQPEAAAAVAANS